MPPDSSHSLGPAVTVIVTALWDVIGVPLCQLYVLFWLALTLPPLTAAIGEALGGLVAVVMTAVMAMFLAAAVVLAGVLVCLLFGLGALAALADRQRRD